MTSATTQPIDPVPTAPSGGAPRSPKGWFGQYLRRLHFLAGIFVGPFILIAALSGAVYALTPQLEQVIYADQLSVPATADPLPLAAQVEASNQFLGPDATPAAVRPAPEPGDTTRVMYADAALGPDESRAIFVDPGTGEVLGDLTVYGTSGALPLRTWVDQLHRGLHLGDVGRVYSELAASWLWVIALAGLGLWIKRAVSGTSIRTLLRPGGPRGLRRTRSWHMSVGVWVAVGMLFLSATGITWSQFGGGNVTKLREVVDWSTPVVATSPDGTSAEGGEHADHGAAPPAAGPAPDIDPATFDSVLAEAQQVNVNTGLVQISAPTDADSAWVVTEIQRSYPTEVDSVAIDGRTLQVVDRVDFVDFPVAAKLARWGIDLHMGSMFGLPNQIVLFLLASGIAAMVVWGYVMWWQRRPKHNPAQRFGVVPPRGALARASLWGVSAVVGLALAMGWFLPVLGASLLGFVIVDALLELRAARRTNAD